MRLCWNKMACFCNAPVSHHNRASRDLFPSVLLCVCVGTVAVKRQIWCMWGDERRLGADSRPESDSPTPEGASLNIRVCVCEACTRLCVKCVCLWAQGGCMERVAWRGERRNAAMSLRSLDSRCLHNNTQRGHVQAGKSRTPRHACHSFKVTVSSAA